MEPRSGGEARSVTSLSLSLLFVTRNGAAQRRRSVQREVSNFLPLLFVTRNGAAQRRRGAQRDRTLRDVPTVQWLIASLTPVTGPLRGKVLC